LSWLGLPELLLDELDALPLLDELEDDARPLLDDELEELDELDELEEELELLGVGSSIPPHAVRPKANNTAPP
jgi:cell division septum initiation protein DivIVA